MTNGNDRDLMTLSPVRITLLAYENFRSSSRGFPSRSAFDKLRMTNIVGRAKGGIAARVSLPHFGSVIRVIRS